MVKENILSIRYAIISLALLSISSFYSALNFRAETYDGFRILFQMMNSQPYQFYINQRKLNYLLNYGSYLTDALINIGTSFSSIYYFLNFSIILNPLLIFFCLIFILLKIKQNDLIPFTILNFALAVYPTLAFHVSLVPETILFGWGAFISWYAAPKNKLGIIFGFFGLFSLLLFASGYEGVLVVSIVFFIHFIYLITKRNTQNQNHYEFIYRSFFLVVLFSCSVFRFKNISHLGTTEYCMDYILKNIPLLFIFLTISIFLIIFSFVIKRFMGTFLPISICSLGIIFLFFDSKDNGFDTAYSIRVISPFMSIACMFLAIQAQTHRINYKHLLNITLSIFFITFLFDLKATYFWSQHRENQKIFLEKFNTGCTKLHTNTWTLGYESILYQMTFQPKYLVFQDEKVSNYKPFGNQSIVDPCEMMLLENSQIIPYGFEEDNVKNFDFSKIKN